MHQVKRRNFLSSGVEGCSNFMNPLRKLWNCAGLDIHIEVVFPVAGILVNNSTLVDRNSPLLLQPRLSTKARQRGFCTTWQNRVRRQGHPNAHNTTTSFPDSSLGTLPSSITLAKSFQRLRKRPSIVRQSRKNLQSLI